MGLFGGRRQRGVTAAEDVARRRKGQVPEVVDRAPARRTAPVPAAGPTFATKVFKFSQIGLTGPTNVEAKLATFIANGWEVVSEDRKRYGSGGKHTVLLRRPQAT